MSIEAKIDRRCARSLKELRRAENPPPKISHYDRWPEIERLRAEGKGAPTIAKELGLPNWKTVFRVEERRRQRKAYYGEREE